MSRPDLLSPATERKRLAELRRYRILGTPAEETFSRAVRLARSLLETTGAAIGFLGERRVFYKAQVGLAVRSYPRTQTPCTQVTLSAEPWACSDLQDVPEFAQTAFVLQNGLRFYAGIPLLGGGVPLGVLSVFSTQPRTLSGAEADLLSDLAETVAELLDARRRGFEPPSQGDAPRYLGEPLEHGSHYVLTAAPDGGLLYANPALKTALGLGTLPQTLYDLYPASTHTALGAALADALITGAARHESALLHPNGTQLPVMQELMRHPHAGVGEGVGMTEPVISLVARDLSAEKQQEAFEQQRSEILELTARGAPLPAVLLRLTSFLEAYCPGMMAAVSLLTGDTLQLEVAPQLPGSFARILDGRKTAPQMGSCAVAAATGARVITPDIRRDPHWYNLRYQALQAGLHACWSEPIVSDRLDPEAARGDGEGAGAGVLGTVALYARSVGGPNATQLRMLREAAQLAAVAVTRQRLYRRLEYRAHYDALTGLPNRQLLGEHLTRALGRAENRDERVGVFLLDLDNFKGVNDSLGHSAGDALLREVAARLSACLPPGASVARSGGDEFVFVAPLPRRDDAARFAFEISAALRPPFTVRGRTFRVGASIGISLYPDDAHDPETLLKAADSAMYAAKADVTASRQGYRLYQREMTDVLEEQLQLEGDFRGALVGDELRLYLQPRFDITERRFNAYEALVRWQHPDRGLLLPGAFLGVAQRAGLLPQLDSWVLREVVLQLGYWAGAGKTERLSCNVSAASFQDDTLLSELTASLGENRALAARLELEITENLLMTDLEGAAAQLRELKRHFPGVRVAIDDFGSGYSSLAYLRHLPVDTLKIDRAFVKDLDQSDTELQRTALAVIRTVIALGRDLGFRVVAEGAETQGQLGMLTALGVDEVQGYVLGRPQPLTEVVVAAPELPGLSERI